MFSHISATLQGLPIIRATRAQEQFLLKYYKFQDHHTSAWFLFLTGVRWLGFRLDMLCFVFFVIVVYSPLIAKEAGLSTTIVTCTLHVFSCICKFHP